MICNKCGATCADDLNFCEKCGNSLQEQKVGADVMKTSVQKTDVPQREKVSANQDDTKKGTTKTVIIIAVIVVIFFLALVFLLVGAGIIVLVATSSSDSQSEGAMIAEESHNEERDVNLSNLNVGDIVVLGVYEQDGNSSNGAEPVEWDVIAEENGRYLLLSLYVLDSKPYDNGMADDTVSANESASAGFCTWETSTVRSWLNGEFYNTVFSANEQQYICLVTNTTGDWAEINDGTMGTDGYWDGGLGGGDTQDKVFLLSIEEVRKYFRDDIIPVTLPRTGIIIPQLLVSPTEYTMEVSDREFYGTLSDFNPYARLNAEGYDEADTVWNDYYYGNVHEDYINNGYYSCWGLRSPGCYVDNASFVEMKMDGKPGIFDADPITMPETGIRPAIWVECD